jgi:hypothetical protein
MVGGRVTDSLKCFQNSGHVLIWGNRAKYAKENNIKLVSIFLVPADNGSGCLSNTSPNLTSSAKSISVDLLAPAINKNGNAKQTSIAFVTGNLHLKELCECSVQVGRIAPAIGIHKAEIKMPKFLTNIYLSVTPRSRVFFRA